MRINQSKLYYFLCALATSLVGVALHFSYQYFNGMLAAVFCAVNESVFEHLKLLFWPVLVFMLVNELVFKSGDFERQTTYLLLSLFFIISAFYTYSGVLGYNVSVIDIAIYFVAVAIFYVLAYLGAIAPHDRSLFANVFAPIAMIALITIFIAFTFNPPEIGLFRDPITGGYGI